ncbi:MAG TPA: hypothetical protein VGM23_06890, partial [Armatimonadota bacterium]
MKRRHGGIFAFIVVILVLFGALAIPSLNQNMRIRRHFTQLFQDIKERDREGVLKFYDNQPVLPAYLDQIMQYNLLGWKIKKITGQPWPM